MLKHTFSQEGEVSREIEILFMRIFGLLALMETISRQVKVSVRERSDTLWTDEIRDNVKYNAASLGANIWDLVCKWNHDIRTVKFWLNTYVSENQTRMKYFVEPLKEWEKKISSLDHITTIFENSGAVNSDYILLELGLKEQFLKNNDVMKDNKNLIQKNKLKDKDCEKYIGIIAKNDIEIAKEKSLHTIVEKTNIDCTKKLTLLEQEKNDLQIECNANKIKLDKMAVLQAELACDKNKIESTEKEIKKIQLELDALKHIKGLLVEKTLDFDTLREELIVSESLVQKQNEDLLNSKKNEASLAEKTLECDTLNQELTSSKSLVQKKNEDLLNSKKNEESLAEKTLECGTLNKELITSEKLIQRQKDKLDKMQLLQNQLEQKILDNQAQNDIPQSDESAELQKYQKLLTNKEKEIRQLIQETITNEKEIEFKSKTIQELKSYKDELVLANGNIRKLSEKSVQLQQSLNKSTDRNTKMQKIINDYKNAPTSNALESEVQRLSESEESNKKIIRSLEKDIEDLFTQLRVAERKGYDVMSPSQKTIHKKMEIDDKKPKKSETEPAKSSYFWSKTGPRSYII